MVNYREILRLQSLQYTQRQIAASIHSSRNTVHEVIERATKAGVTWPLEDDCTNETLFSVLYPEKTIVMNQRQEPDYRYIHKELAKSGVNLTLLWTEYCEQTRTNGNTPYMYTQFCEHYRKWARLTKATMRITHKPGEAMQVDWAGTTMPIHDKTTGEIREAYVFIAVLPCSGYAYAEVCQDMKSESWLLCHAHAYNYFGGVTRLLVPDNLKTGIQRNTRYETIFNPSYQEMAEHYDTAIVPARVKRPQDKSAAEGTVKYVTTWIIAALRNQKFFSLKEVNSAVSKKLEELNRLPFKQRAGNRREAYIGEEREFMKSLPSSPYELATWSTAKVPRDYLISDGKNKYSVPFDLIGEQVDIRLTSQTVEVFFHSSRVASHPRDKVIKKQPIIQPEHMPQAHRKYLSYNAEEFLVWGQGIGLHTNEVVRFFLESPKEPEQGYKACASLTKLCDRYGHHRLENACERVLAYTTSPSIRHISAILKNKQDKQTPGTVQKNPQESEGYGITRGAAYFGKDGDAND